MSLVYPHGKLEKAKRKRVKKLLKRRFKDIEIKQLKEAIEKNPEKFRDDFHRAFPQLKPKRKRDIKQPKGSI
jgi:hypothetical protein